VGGLGCRATPTQREGPMPPDQQNPRLLPEQEHLKRQLETLGRYVAEFHQQRQPAKTVAAQPPSGAQSPAEPQPRRPSSGWLLGTGLLVVLALAGGVVVGAVAWSQDRPVVAGEGGPGVSSARQRPATTASWASHTTMVGPVASAACKTAVDRANTMLAIAVALQRELAEYRSIMRDRSNRELSGREVVKRALPGLGDGARESARLDQALSAYRQVVDQCKLRKP
jgi:hypothetical protein